MSHKHRACLGLGANLGDREWLLLQAIEQLRAIGDVARFSSPYETAPMYYTDQPPFLNLAVVLYTALSPTELLAALKGMERALGRAPTFRYGPRLIDLDILLYDDLILETPELVIPHALLHERAFVLVPLAEIGSRVVEPRSGRTIGQLAETIDVSGVRRQRWQLAELLRRDLQAEPPEHSVSLMQVGIIGVERIIYLPAQSGTVPCYTRIDLTVGLPPNQRGVHASRLSEALDRILGAQASENSSQLVNLAAALASEMARAQQTRSARVRLAARYPLIRSGFGEVLSGDFCTVLAEARVVEGRTRSLLGVEVVGITACPCAQTLVSTWAQRDLAEAGFAREDAMRLLSALPMATHSQRSRTTLLIGAADPPAVTELIDLAAEAMSSCTSERLKRPDELLTVLQAHRRPRFAEDVVRELLALVRMRYSDLPDDGFLEVTQVNEESIHAHNIMASWHGTLAELRREMREATSVAAHTAREDWLAGSA
jgi:GTP cyclohydrolase-4